MDLQHNEINTHHAITLTLKCQQSIYINIVGTCISIIRLIKQQRGFKNQTTRSGLTQLNCNSGLKVHEKNEELSSFELKDSTFRQY